MLQKISMALFAFSLIACATDVNAQKASPKKTDAPTFKKLGNGLEYAIITDAPGTKKIVEGSFVSMHIRTKISDSSMFDSYKMNNNEPIEQQLNKEFLGGFMDGFTLLSAGDSAIFRMPVDSALKGGQMPPFAKSGDPVTYIVKVVSVKTKEEYDNEKKSSAAKQIATDDKILQDYIAKNNLKAQKTASGLYYIIEKAGNGKMKYILPSSKSL